MGFQAVIFTLGNEEYGIPIEVVHEITRLSEIHPIPKAPEYIKGLISIRGEAIPLINLHNRFHIDVLKPEGYAILVEINGKVVGMAVDEVKEVRTLDEIAPPPPLVTAPFVSGIVNLPDRIIIQINPERILDNSEISELIEM